MQLFGVQNVSRSKLYDVQVPPEQEKNEGENML
jgi:hypothetical protein